MKRFSIGGPRQPVYDFLQSRGFVMSKWSDKCWTRADGVTVNVFGAGSMARVHDATGKLLSEGELASVI